MEFSTPPRFEAAIISDNFTLKFSTLHKNLQQHREADGGGRRRSSATLPQNHAAFWPSAPPLPTGAADEWLR